MTSSVAFAALEAEVNELRSALLTAEATNADEISSVHPSHRKSAVNLVHYVELRNHDIRRLQVRLGAVGLSSLGRCEPHVLATVEAILALLAQLTGHPPVVPEALVGFVDGDDLLEGNAEQLLGPAPATRSTRVMVTLPSEAADDAALVAELVAAGMDVARVNCAHDDAEAWARMVTAVRSAPERDGRSCRLSMDLAGPKLRTGPLEPGPRVKRIAPKRDRSGCVTSPARVWLTAPGAGSRPSDGSSVEVPVDDAAWLARRRPDDRLELRDARGADRHWRVVDVRTDGCTATTEQTSYVATGLELLCPGDDGGDVAVIGELPAIEQFHRVLRGDRVILSRSMAPAPVIPGAGVHRIGCSLPEAFAHARPGERVWLDDGKIGGTIERVDDAEITVEITDVRPAGANLRAGKGINLPDTELGLGAVTPQDFEDLTFVARHADLVNVSFVRRRSDIAAVQRELERLGTPQVGIVLKIETVAAFRNLPGLLLQAMRSEKFGVMIARGDLAVEVGFERLAEVQEEMLWVCEAAHAPVIWATQVLDTLARTGQPSRAEITDAAMAERAECVMLNKGPYIAEAIDALDSILTRMERHQQKKRSLLRQLHAWEHAGPEMR